MRKFVTMLLAASAILPGAAAAQRVEARADLDVGGREGRAERRAERAERRAERVGRPSLAAGAAAAVAARDERRAERDRPRRERDGGSTAVGGGLERPARDADARREWRQERRDDRQDRRDDRREDWRGDRRDDRREWREDRREWRQDRREDRREWRDDRRDRGSWLGVDDRRRGGWNGRAYDGHRVWNRGWRNDRRYDWNGFRGHNRGAYRLPRYYAPQGFGYGYRRFGIGVQLTRSLWQQDYWIDDPFAFRLPPAYGPYRWVRYFDDALLVDLRTGRVIDAVHGIFW